MLRSAIAVDVIAAITSRVRNATRPLVPRFLRRQRCLHRWRQHLHPLDERRNPPQLVVRRPLAVGKHSGPSNPVFSDPEDLRLGILGPAIREPGYCRKQAVLSIELVGLARPPMASRTVAQVVFTSSDQVLIRHRDRIRNLRSFAPHRGMYRRSEQGSLPSRGWPVPAHLGIPKSQISQPAD